MNRRHFMQLSAAGLALSALGADAAEILEGKPKRVGLIGTGWYGKADLLRLIGNLSIDVLEAR